MSCLPYWRLKICSLKKAQGNKITKIILSLFIFNVSATWPKFDLISWYLYQYNNYLPICKYLFIKLEKISHREHFGISMFITIYSQDNTGAQISDAPRCHGLEFCLEDMKYFLKWQVFLTFGMMFGGKHIVLYCGILAFESWVWHFLVLRLLVRSLDYTWLFWKMREWEWELIPDDQRSFGSVCIVKAWE